MECSSLIASNLSSCQGMAWSTMTTNKGMFDLYSDDIHVWVIDLTSSAIKWDDYSVLLSRDELFRAQRYKFRDDRNNFITRRGILRLLLSFYINVEPSLIQFEYRSLGKPFIIPLDHHQSIRFNLSHTRELAAIAITQFKEVGIDIEKCNSQIDYRQISERFFTENERIKLLSCREDKRIKMFTRIWTRKEAFVKALGLGMSMPLENIDILRSPGQKQLNCNRELWHGYHESTTLRDLSFPHDHLGAVAICGNMHDIRIEEWRD